MSEAETLVHEVVVELLRPVYTKVEELERQVAELTRSRNEQLKEQQSSLLTDAADDDESGEVYSFSGGD